MYGNILEISFRMCSLVVQSRPMSCMKIRMINEIKQAYINCINVPRNMMNLAVFAFPFPISVATMRPMAHAVPKNGQNPHIHTVRKMPKELTCVVESSKRSVKS